MCYKIKLHPFGSEKNAYCPHLKCGDNYMPHYSSCVISGHIQHLAQQQFRVCSKQRQSRKRHWGLFQAAEVAGTKYSTSKCAFSWDDTPAISNVLRVGGPTPMCFSGKREERKMGERNNVQYTKILVEKVCACTLQHQARKVLLPGFSLIRLE